MKGCSFKMNIYIYTKPYHPRNRCSYDSAYILICIGIALSNRCTLPIVPTDLFPRELSQIIKKKYSIVKISFDVICLLTTACMTGFFLGHIKGLGIGTIHVAFTMGKGIAIAGQIIDKRMIFVTYLSRKK